MNANGILYLVGNNGMMRLDTNGKEFIINNILTLAFGSFAIFYCIIIGNSSKKLSQNATETGGNTNEILASNNKIAVKP